MDGLHPYCQVCPFIVNGLAPDQLLDLDWDASGTYKWQCVGGLFRIQDVLC